MVFAADDPDEQEIVLRVVHVTALKTTIAQEFTFADSYAPFVRSPSSVGSLRARADGSFALISCTGKDVLAQNRTIVARCRQAPSQATAEVAVTYPDGSGRLLESGRGIEAQSLRLQGSTLTWRRNGRRRRAQLRATGGAAT